MLDDSRHYSQYRYITSSKFLFMQTPLSEALIVAKNGQIRVFHESVFRKTPTKIALKR